MTLASASPHAPGISPQVNRGSAPTSTGMRFSFATDEESAAARGKPVPSCAPRIRRALQTVQGGGKGNRAVRRYAVRMYHQIHAQRKITIRCMRALFSAPCRRFNASFCGKSQPENKCAATAATAVTGTPSGSRAKKANQQKNQNHQPALKRSCTRMVSAVLFSWHKAVIGDWDVPVEKKREMKHQRGPRRHTPPWHHEDAYSAQRKEARRYVMFTVFDTR